MTNLDKHSAAFEQMTAIREFLDWLESQKEVRLCDKQSVVDIPAFMVQLQKGMHRPAKYGLDGPIPETKVYLPWLGDLEAMLLEYFGINPRLLERDRRKLLELAREASL